MSAIQLDAQISDELVAIIRKVSHTPQSFADWVKDEQLWAPADIGAIIKEEEKVSSNIIDLLPDAGALRTRHKSAVVRIWWLC